AKPGVLPETADVRFELLVGGLVERLARTDAAEIEAAVGAVEMDAPALDLPDLGALLAVAVFSGIEDDAISGFERGGTAVGEFDPGAAADGDGAEQRAPLFPEASVGEVGVVGPSEPTGGEA